MSVCGEIENIEHEIKQSRGANREQTAPRVEHCTFHEDFWLL